MVKNLITSLALAAYFCFLGAGMSDAADVLDGRSFSGMIGPADNPDLQDILYFDDGHFWSDICTRCGFVPGPYETEETEEGIRFTGILESEDRGRFDYDGLVRDDGSIRVTITWERRRWYWTSKREIIFDGAQSVLTENASLSKIRQVMQTVNPDGNPTCARF